MKAMKIAELKDGLSATLRSVQRGARVLVTDRDRPIAMLVPIEDDEDGCTVIPAKRPFASIRGRRYRPLRTPIDSLALLRAERGER